MALVYFYNALTASNYTTPTTIIMSTPGGKPADASPPPPPKRQELPVLSFREVVNKAAASAVRGGTAGAIAMGANVACLMWMRTTVRFFRFISFRSTRYL